jgi:glutamate synthase (ferredoxin)
MVNVYQLIECEDAEIALVKGKIETHVTLTGSVRGQSILDGWPDTAGKILKIMPQDYERVLHAITRAEASGLTGDDAIQAAFEENVAAGH